MGFETIKAGKDVPNDINVVIEISMNGEPIKYEVDKDSGALFVDRFMTTAMHYPCNYGYIPHTLGGDGDPLDVLVVTPIPLPPGCVIRCRPVGVLNMVDEAGEDAKILAVPVDKLIPFYNEVQKPEDLPALLLEQIQHFFEHYKDLEKGKFVKVQGWADADAAKKAVVEAVENYQK